MSGLHVAEPRMLLHRAPARARTRTHASSRLRPPSGIGARLVAVALVAIVVGLAGWRLHGGGWERVETASMGTQAPVGTLLWVAPADFASLRPGDLITFRPPGTDATYSHLVRSINADGTISTQGRITAPDPWRLHAQDLLGRVVWSWKGVGWLVLAAPLLVLGGLVVTLASRQARDRDLRVAIALIGAACVIALCLVVYRPLTRADQISFVPVAGGARATYVSTGLLPVRITGSGGHSVVLSDGQIGSVLATTRTGGTHHRFAVSVRPDIPWTWWLAVVGACFVPILGRRVVRRPERA
jgi:hypothetical protein